MTEPIAVDVPVKPPSAVRSIASAVPPPAKAADKPADAAPPPDKPPSLLARVAALVAARVTKKQAAIGASAVFSLAAGVAGVRLVWPGDPETPPAATQPIAPDPKPFPKADPKPAAVAEPGKSPDDTILPQRLPLVSVGPAVTVPETTPAVLPPLPSGMRKPVIEVGGSAAPGDKPAPKLGDPPPGRWGDPTPPPEFDLSGFPKSPAGPVVPAAGSEPVAPPALPPLPLPPAGGVAVPWFPWAESPKPAPPVVPVPVPLPGLVPPVAGSMNPTAPGTPVVPPVTPGGVGDIVMPKPPPLPDPKELVPKDSRPPVIGSPPGGGSPMAPPSLPGVGPVVPLVRPDLDPTPPSTPVKPVGERPITPVPDLNPGNGGAKIEFTKPPSSPTVTPIVGTERTPTTSYDVDIYYLKPGDTWQTVSREFYNDARFAAALQAYNRNKPLQGEVDVPPLHVVKRYVQAPPGAAAVPAGRGGPGPEWGAAAVRAGGDKTFRVPQGGMSMRAVARVMLGSDQRWDDIHKLNPHLRADDILPAGTELRLPPDARNPG